MALCALVSATWVWSRELFSAVLLGCPMAQTPAFLREMSFWKLQQEHISDAARAAASLGAEGAPGSLVFRMEVTLLPRAFAFKNGLL